MFHFIRVQWITPMLTFHVVILPSLSLCNGYCNSIYYISFFSWSRKDTVQFVIAPQKSSINIFKIIDQTNLSTTYYSRIIVSYSTDREYRREFIRYHTIYISLFIFSRHNCLIIVTSPAIDCAVINRTYAKRVRHGVYVWGSSFLSSFMDMLCHVRN